MAQAKNKEVAAFELKVAQKQSEYLDRLRTVQDSIATAQQVAAIGQDAAWWDKLIYNVENLGNTINNYAQRAVVGHGDQGQRMDKRCHPLRGRADFPDVLLRHPRGAAHLHGHHDDILPHHVRPVPRPAVELGVEPVDVQVPFPLAVGLRDLHVPVLR